MTYAFLGKRNRTVDSLRRVSASNPSTRNLNGLPGIAGLLAFRRSIAKKLMHPLAGFGCRLGWASAAALLVLCGMAAVASATTYPSSTTYYIATSSCSDSNPGTSSSSPWCDFTPVNGNTFSAGDSILLAAGDSWSGEMTPLGSGSSGNPITIGCYGSSCSTSYPTINVGSSNPGIYLVNPSWWTVTNLTLTGYDSAIVVDFTQLENQGLVFENLDFTSLSGDSIVFEGYNSNPPTSIPSDEYIISGVTFQNITISDAGTIALSDDYAQAQQVNNGYPNAQQNILFKNVYASTYTGCFGIQNAENVTVMDSFWQDGDTDGGCGAGTYMVAVSNVTFNNSVFYDDPWTNSNDNGAFVYDNQETEVAWNGDYFYKNAASGVEGAENSCFNSCTSSTNSDFQVSSSAFNDNSTDDESSYYGDISVYYSPETTMTVENNLYSDTSQTYNAFVRDENSTYQTLTSNTNLGAGATIYNSAYQFSSTQGSNQWSYEYCVTGSCWVPMTTYSGGVWSYSTGAWIDQFDTQPDNSGTGWTGRMWTAPSTGTITVSGWVLKNTTGTAVNVGINHSGTWVWGNGSGSYYTLGANDQVGVSTDVTFSVTQGDTVFFCVGNVSSGDTGAVVSWAPSIAYVPAAGSNQLTNPTWATGSLSGWTEYGSPTGAISVSSSSPYTGDSYEVSMTSGSSFNVAVGQEITGLTDGTPFTASVWAQTSGTTNAYMYVGDGVYTTQLCQANLPSTATSWTQYTCTGTVDSTGDLFFAVGSGNDSGGAYANFDSASLTLN